jgi:hypothetical protein
MDCYVNESSTKLTKFLTWVCQPIMKRLKKGRCPLILRTYCFPGQHKVQVGKRVYRYIKHTSPQNSVTDMCQSISIVMIYQPIRLTSPCYKQLALKGNIYLQIGKSENRQSITFLYILFNV